MATKDGHLVGTLCVIDRQPRTLSNEQTQALEILGRQVVANIELNRDLQELKDALAARDLAQGPSGEAAGGLDPVIEKLREITSELQAVRDGRK